MSNGQRDIQFENVQKCFGDVEVISSLNLHVKSGERLVLLGPSGCGKSTLIRLIAGLETPTSGTIKMGGQIVNDVDAADRNVAMVFQNYALYPHMTVFDNIAFSLKLRKIKRSVIEQKVKEAAEMVAIDRYLDRKPAELSGGQRQRVALARAAVRHAPYFLLDEPLSNLDAILRVHARHDLVEMHEKLQNTMVYVTHDQLEAMTIGQRIAILNQGVLQQMGTPEEIYDFPANRFVASFIGTPPMNLLPFERRHGQIYVGHEPIKRADDLSYTLPLREIEANRQLLLGIRPEKIKMPGYRRDENEGNRCLNIESRFVRREHIGAQFLYHFKIGNSRVLVTSTQKMPFSTQEKMPLSFPLKHLHFFNDDASGSRLSTPVQTEKQPVLSIHTS